MIGDDCVLLFPSPQTNSYETMRWFVAGVAVAVNVAGCVAIGVLGDDVTATFVGYIAEIESTALATDDTPAESVTVNVT
jgi:hypothetical protein